jgi:hypothetical protein
MSTRTRKFAFTLGLVACSLTASFGAQASEASFDHNHPRRSEVLDRLHNINNRLNANYGNLDGHYYQLKHEEAAIHNQERTDKNINGGYITPGQQAHLNAEENSLNQQIKHDK